MIRAVAALALAASAAHAAAQDYERERRWAAEVVPNLVVGDAVQLKLPSGREFLGLFTERKQSPAAFLLVHGMGVHPDHGVTGALRVALVDLGYTTLSIQMPVQKSDAVAGDYAMLLPEAAERIRAGARWLAQQGHRRIVLVTHSLASRMANAYYENTADSPFVGWVSLGIIGRYGDLGGVHAPLLDVYGENDFPEILRDSAERRASIGRIPGSRQLRIAGADHYYTGREAELASAIRDFVTVLK